MELHVQKYVAMLLCSYGAMKLRDYRTMWLLVLANGFTL